MFTGIIQDQGYLLEQKNIDGDVRFSFATSELNLANANLGDSIAVNGVCLTIIEKQAKQFVVDASTETLNVTSLGTLDVNDKVNLELAMTPKSAFGGHIVSGHVDCMATIKDLHEDARSWRYELQIPKPFAKYIAAKGSVTIDGVSLTVNSISDDAVFGINIIPHTYEKTTFSDYQIGDQVNIEIDMIARYVERLLEFKNT